MDENKTDMVITTKSIYYNTGYYQDGFYTDERKKIHESIIIKLLETVNPSKREPLVTFLGGGAASGKSTIAKAILESYRMNNEHVLRIDSDEIKKLLPEYEQLVKDDRETMAQIFHDESSDIAERLYYEAIRKKVNIILDGTMKDTEKYLQYFIEARNYKYRIGISIADVPLDEAIRRAQIRYEIENRRVPDEIILMSHKLVPNSFIKLKDFADSFYLYDNSDIHPKQFYVKLNNDVKILDEQRLKQFISKSEDLSHWIYLEKALKLKDILILGNGVLLENDQTLQMLEHEVNTFHSIKGDQFHTIVYLHKESTTILSITLCSPQLINTIMDKSNCEIIDEYEFE